MTAIALHRRSPPDPRLLQRSLLLAVLLHVWLVLMFGNTTGTALPGQGVWGSLSVRLSARSGSQADAPPSPNAGGAPGTPTRPAPDSRPQRATPDAQADGETRTATLPLPEGFKPVERETLSPPSPRSAPPVTTPAELPAAVGRLDTRPDTALTPLAPAAALRSAERRPEVPPQPADLPAPVQRLEAAPATVADLVRPSDLRPAAATPALAPPSTELPTPVRRLEAPSAGTATATLPRATELRTQAPTASVSDATPTQALPTPVQRLEAPSADAGGVSRLSSPRELQRPAPGAATALSGTPDLPTPVTRLEAADAGAGVAPLQPAQNPRASLSTPAAGGLDDLASSLPGQVSAPAGPAQGDPSAPPLAGVSTGRSDGPRAGADMAAAPTPPASGATRAPLNLSMPRGDMSSRRSPGLVELLPPPPERKGKLEQAIEDTANKDCRKAYSNAGILAVVPLAIDAARGKGCKW
ncbi:hypothetical protein [Roseateles asaccharophilus]|uniref:Meckel syndrome type 1 protein n=1 Tax=Roseateles asaccharophilus TaxID=582607 RepID=A0ABU2AB13_9BURK|nr:hypothetical protein [Roseateles asaccharophilus]MDR7334359.1 Meckel syndrome type 1 protein [Roseateles asaccharophilus]